MNTYPLWTRQAQLAVLQRTYHPFPKIRRKIIQSLQKTLRKMDNQTKPQHPTQSSIAMHLGQEKPKPSIAPPITRKNPGEELPSKDPITWPLSEEPAPQPSDHVHDPKDWGVPPKTSKREEGKEKSLED